jgi:hypothetical protein
LTTEKKRKEKRSCNPETPYKENTNLNNQGRQSEKGRMQQYSSNTDQGVEEKKPSGIYVYKYAHSSEGTGLLGRGGLNMACTKERRPCHARGGPSKNMS